MAKIIVFGTSDFAELAHFYLTHDSKHEVIAFSVTKEFLKENIFKKLPVISFEEIEKEYNPKEYKFFVPMYHSTLNKDRELFYNKTKAKGYELISYVSSKATIFPGLQIGDNCLILENNTIQPFATIGNNVSLWSGNHIGHHSIIKDHVTFTSHIVLSGHSIVESYSVVGVNATIGHGITIGKETIIGAGALVTKNTPEKSVFIEANTDKFKLDSSMFIRFSKM